MPDPMNDPNRHQEVTNIIRQAFDSPRCGEGVSVLSRVLTDGDWIFERGIIGSDAKAAAHALEQAHRQPGTVPVRTWHMRFAGPGIPGPAAWPSGVYYVPVAKGVDEKRMLYGRCLN